MSYEKHIELYGDGIGKVEYVEHMGSDLTIVNSARVSFGSHKDVLDEKDAKLINYLVNPPDGKMHTSVFEHCAVTFRFKVPLFIRSQHHRHRTWSYNEISRRYTASDIEFYEPETFRTQAKRNRQASNAEDLIDPMINVEDADHPKFGEWIHPHPASQAVREHHQASLDLYHRLMEVGVCREQARGVLPQNMYTTYYGTVSLLNALKFCSLRLPKGAQWEIRRVAEAMVTILKDLYPIAVEAWISNLDDDVKELFTDT